MLEKKRKFIAKEKGYFGYYQGGTGYTPKFYCAKIFDESELSEIPNLDDHEIIFLDTKEGLELILNEIEKTSKKIIEYTQEISLIKEGMSNLIKENYELIENSFKENKERFNYLTDLFEGNKK